MTPSTISFPLAMLISSGRSYKKNFRDRFERRRPSRKQAQNNYGKYSDDFMFPDSK